MRNKKTTPAFDSWLWKLNKNDRLPRGRYFKGKKFEKMFLMPSINQVDDPLREWLSEWLRTARDFTPPIRVTQRRADFFDDSNGQSS